MNLKKMALAAAIACVSYTGNSLAQEAPIQLVSGCADTSCAAAPCECGQPACGCESIAAPGGCAGLGCLGSTSCDCAGGGCDAGCGGGCDAGGCDNMCGCLGGDCDLGDPWTLFGEHCGWSAGGWISTGYHDKALPIFNDRPDEFNLHQAWLWAEKSIDTSNGFDIGGRIDYLYGIDAQNTQAFGKDDGHWDNDWDNGEYGHALPQVYGEVGYGDLSVKVGHFYTIIGWEVVPATGNFFYSHAYTFNNSEPFTHTGALATYNASDDLTVWSGYTTGWDSGFKDNGDAFLGGFSLGLTDKLTLIYATSIGTFADDTSGGNTGDRENGYMHSIVADVTLTDSLQYIFQTDLLDTDQTTGGVEGPGRETFGINQYLIKSINDCWGVGARFEWWNTETGGTGDSDVYALTLGVNHKPHANVMIRPEVRWDWDDDGVVGLENGDDDQTTFGVDTIFTF